MIGIEPDDARFGLVVTPQPYHLDEPVRLFVCEVFSLASIGCEVVERPFGVFVRNPDRLPAAGASWLVKDVTTPEDAEAVLTILDESRTAQRLQGEEADLVSARV